MCIRDRPNAARPPRGGRGALLVRWRLQLCRRRGHALRRRPPTPLALRAPISHQTVAEIWKAFGLKPWRQDSFKVSPDPDLVEKIRDLVGLYMSPPVAAAVFAVDEKPQIQALNRTAPTLPMLPTTPQRATHDYERNGTCDLFAALDMAKGTVITDIRPRHTAEDFVAFLNLINRNVPAGLDVQIILDNLSAHKAPTVQKWLLRHRRFHFHFTPTYGLSLIHI